MPRVKFADASESGSDTGASTPKSAASVTQTRIAGRRSLLADEPTDVPLNSNDYALTIHFTNDIAFTTGDNVRRNSAHNARTNGATEALVLPRSKSPLILLPSRAVAARRAEMSMIKHIRRARHLTSELLSPEFRESDALFLKEKRQATMDKLAADRSEREERSATGFVSSERVSIMDRSRSSIDRISRMMENSRHTFAYHQSRMSAAANAEANATTNTHLSAHEEKQDDDPFSGVSASQYAPAVGSQNSLIPSGFHFSRTFDLYNSSLRTAPEHTVSVDSFQPHFAPFNQPNLIRRSAQVLIARPRASDAEVDSWWHEKKENDKAKVNTETHTNAPTHHKNQGAPSPPPHQQSSAQQHNGQSSTCAHSQLWSRHETPPLVYSPLSPEWLVDRADYKHFVSNCQELLCLNTLDKAAEQRNVIETKRLLHWIGQMPVFDQIPTKAQLELLAEATVITVPSNTFIYNVGELGAAMFLLVQGECKSFTQMQIAAPNTIATHRAADGHKRNEENSAAIHSPPKTLRMRRSLSNNAHHTTHTHPHGRTTKLSVLPLKPIADGTASSRPSSRGVRLSVLPPPPPVTHRILTTAALFGLRGDDRQYPNAASLSANQTLMSPVNVSAVAANVRVKKSLTRAQQCWTTLKSLLNITVAFNVSRIVRVADARVRQENVVALTEAIYLSIPYAEHDRVFRQHLERQSRETSDLFRALPFLSKWRNRNLSRLGKAVTTMAWKAGEVIIKDSSLLHHLYFISKGTVELTKSADIISYCRIPTGKKEWEQHEYSRSQQFMIHHRKAPHYFGEEILNGSSRSDYTVRATTNVSGFVLPRSSLHLLMQETTLAYFHSAVETSRAHAVSVITNAVTAHQLLSIATNKRTVGAVTVNLRPSIADEFAREQFADRRSFIQSTTDSDDWFAQNKVSEEQDQHAVTVSHDPRAVDRSHLVDIRLFFNAFLTIQNT